MYETYVTDGFNRKDYEEGKYRRAVMVRLESSCYFIHPADENKAVIVVLKLLSLLTWPSVTPTCIIAAQ